MPTLLHGSLEYSVVRSNELHHMIHGNLRSVKDLTTGSYNRFVDRHPELSLRSSEPLSRAGNEADAASMGAFFYELTKLVIEHNLDSGRVWNMDETSFVSKHQSNSVLAVRGMCGRKPQICPSICLSRQP
ncbi:hypothetical protein PR003_g14453 [Phytophthora rubi]|uniref:Uncharacterized protein n=1 Tax=Phytophthora rubi TaxID=129364 RepID=A0A6A3KCM2_9STRA|nr:hypothetical protein PR001_g17743 [Phytophthora rubi]KAE9009925.1 hypothetical protein PR002_g15499 [Phytophthora rubi]KAE9332554.1 hypothetical protein PR003_g14453 [Phytophthora rubi]